jgi:hypothetical protein
MTPRMKTTNHTIEVNLDRYNHADKKTGQENKGKQAAGNAVKVDFSFLILPEILIYTKFRLDAGMLITWTTMVATFGTTKRGGCF